MLLSKIALATDLQEKGSNTSRSGMVSISDFELLKPISEGGSAKVFLARKKRTGEALVLHCTLQCCIHQFIRAVFSLQCCSLPCNAVA
jgi:hypothetical protein